MTAIVGVVDDTNAEIYIGADSAATNDRWSQQIRADRKVFCKDGFIFGFTDSFRMGQLLRYELVIPDHVSSEEDVYGYMVVNVIGAIRSCLKEGGYAKKKDEEESGGEFLIGYRGHLFRIGKNYQVGESVHGYAVVGSGTDLALGALYATASSKMPVRDRVRCALQAAQEFNAGVREPFHIEVLEYDKEVKC